MRSRPTCLANLFNEVGGYLLWYFEVRVRYRRKKVHVC